ncbi:DUF3017 domain-containing protein [Luteipulveratus halotolerans]|uniref:DUF3017 domain-containing protein n=1 Tax=Luteipulveratus halotolerans TaxID=1631356 RepID=A0A0L6CJF9_9MICO|nr:DUF3017 domain-containing protein [Luteipulveratus halotolerans]KNX37869.1 hypothetical protein VV01_13025 [Luteipulveratus halotolerans]
MIPSRLGPVWWVLVAGCLTSVVLMLVGPVRAGGYLLAAVLALVGLARLALPAGLCDGVAVRSRGLDAATYAALAVAVVVIFAQVKLP